MIPRIKTIKALPDYLLFVLFDDEKQVIYDVKTDMNLPGYRQLQEIPGLFNQVQLDESRTCVWWNEEIDLPSDIIYEYGHEIEDHHVTGIQEATESEGFDYTQWQREYFGNKSKAALDAEMDALFATYLYQENTKKIV